MTVESPPPPSSVASSWPGLLLPKSCRAFSLPFMVCLDDVGWRYGSLEYNSNRNRSLLAVVLCAARVPTIECC